MSGKKDDPESLRDYVKSELKQQRSVSSANPLKKHAMLHERNSVIKKELSLNERPAS
jgi:hypothetical protein